MTATAPTSAPAVTVTRRGRRANAALWTLQIVLALFFAFASAMPKLIAHPSAVESFDVIGYGTWFMYLIGALELAGAIGLVVPRLAGITAIAFIGLMIGAALFQIAYFDGENVATPVVIGLLMGLIAWRRPRRA
ncbi:DoxX family protein [Streptomyces sp. NPDC002574]|uniref:DoxX family protein n=1 Tax=Streptomyces sp. NPDC002574 TaxID=3364652 RepID=UPI00369739AD